MKILHTSDWHIGRNLYKQKRYDEFDAFLSWLVKTIKDEQINALIAAGDIFDTTTPTNRSQEIYYRFLCNVINSQCRHVVIVGGNHDSASFLNAPKDILYALNIHVIGDAEESCDDEVLILKDHKDEPELIVCAIPYLRDRDIRIVEPYETIEDKERKLIKGIKKHYLQVCELAEYKRKTLERENKLNYNRIPLIATGHLFTTKGKVVEDDGVRDLYVGTLAHIPWDTFPDYVDYVALGHLHIPQKVGQLEHIRYSGSPIPMGYGEAYQEKKVVTVEFETNSFNLDIQKKPTNINNIQFDKIPIKISEITVPCFQQLERITGDLNKIKNRIKELKLKNSSCWLEIEYSGEEIIDKLNEVIYGFLDDDSDNLELFNNKRDNISLNSRMEILKVKNRQIYNQAVIKVNDYETLDDIDVDDLFLRCLDASKVVDQDRASLIELYKEVVLSIYEDDINAE